MKIRLIKKTAITLLLTAISGFSLYAEDMKTDMKMMEGVYMMEGKMVHLDNRGKFVTIEKEMALPDGTMVMKNGDVVMKDGKKMKMKVGEMMTMDGKISMMDDGMKKSVTEKANRE